MNGTRKHTAPRPGARGCRHNDGRGSWRGPSRVCVRGAAGSGTGLTVGIVGRVGTVSRSWPRGRIGNGDTVRRRLVSSYDAEYSRRLSAKRWADGVCVRCRRHREQPDRRACDHCLEWARTAGRRLRAIRRFFEACVWCGGCLAAHSRLYCARHLRERQEGARRRYLAKRLATRHATAIGRAAA